MTEQNNTDWIKEEANSLKRTSTQFEQLPPLKLMPNVVTELEVDASKEWQKWIGADSKGKVITKKIIPVFVSGVRMNWWLNVSNPIYSEIVFSCSEGKNKFKILQTGTQAQTKYVILK